MLTSEEKQAVVARLKRIEGHTKKVREMVENENYCMDIITQSMAVQSALRAVDRIIIKKHLETCVREAFVTNKNVEKRIDEVMATIKFSQK